MADSRGGWRQATNSFAFQGNVKEGVVREVQAPSPSPSPRNQQNQVTEGVKQQLAAHRNELKTLTQINSSLKAQLEEFQKKQLLRDQQLLDSSTNIASQHLKAAVSSNSVLGKPFIRTVDSPSSGGSVVLTNNNNSSYSRGAVSIIYKRCSASLSLLQTVSVSPSKTPNTSSEYVQLLTSVLSETLSTGGSLCGVYGALLLLICDRNERSVDDLRRVIPPSVDILLTLMSLELPGEAITCIESVVFSGDMHVDLSSLNEHEGIPHTEDEEIVGMALSKPGSKNKVITSSTVLENGRLDPKHHRYLLEKHCHVAFHPVIVGGNQPSQSCVGIDTWSGISTLVPSTKNNITSSLSSIHLSSREALVLCRKMCFAGGGIGPVLLKQAEYSPESISGLVIHIIESELPRCSPVLISVVLAAVGFVRNAEKRGPNKRLLQLLMTAIKGFSVLPPPTNQTAAAAIEGLFPHIRCEHSYRQIYRLALNDAGIALKLVQDLSVRSEGGINATARKITSHRPGDSGLPFTVDQEALNTAMQIAFFMGSVLKEPEYKTFRNAIFAREEGEDEVHKDASRSPSGKSSRTAGDSPARRRPKMDENNNESVHTEKETSDNQQETDEMRSQMSYMCFFRIAEQASNLVIIMEKVISQPTELAPLQECFTHTVIVLDALLNYCPEISIYGHLLFGPVSVIDDFIQQNTQVLTSPLSSTRLRVFSEAARRMTLLNENLRIR